MFSVLASSEVEGNKVWWRRERGWPWGRVDPREHGVRAEEALADLALLGLSVRRDRGLLCSPIIMKSYGQFKVRRELELKDPFTKI